MLITHHFLFSAQVVSELELDDHSGSALRGNLFEAVWQRFCTNKASASCAACPLHSICPVSALVAPLREENARGRDLPRPYVILPPLDNARRYKPGETLEFSITLFGSIIQLLPYIIMSVHELEANGLGRRLPENHGLRGQFQITRVESYHPFNGESCVIYERGRALVQVPTLAVEQADVVARAESLSDDSITLEFFTPTRIVDQERLVHQLTFRALVQRLTERFNNLQAEYGQTSSTTPIQVHKYNRSRGNELELADPEVVVSEEPDLIKLASDIVCQRDETRWEDVKSYSRRQQRFTPVGGLMGQITFAGNLAPFRELLVWGELIHVGKSVVKGNGWYKIHI